jgi:predicted alpha-1,6-mannanase (GH76 family)
LDQLLLAYYPQPSFDDMAWYSLAYARVYEANKTNTDFFRVSKDIFEWMWTHGWDESACGGGVWFDQTQQGKETIENAQMFQLGLKLGRLEKEVEEKKSIKR